MTLRSNRSASRRRSRSRATPSRWTTPARHHRWTEPINGVLNYSIAHTMFGIKTALHPHLPNNDGTMRSHHRHRTGGQCPQRALPSARHVRWSLAYYPVEAMYGVSARSSRNGDRVERHVSALVLVFSGRDDGARPFVYIFWGNGGRGASHDRDGVSAVAFPANARNTPAELFETTTPLLVSRSSSSPIPPARVGSEAGSRNGSASAISARRPSPSQLPATTTCEGHSASMAAAREVSAGCRWMDATPI